MAWVEFLSKPATIVADLANTLVTNGWVLHDDLTPEKKVLKTTTTPINAKTLVIYIIIERVANSLRDVQFRMCSSWDNVMHSGTDISNFCLWSWYKDAITQPASFGLTDQLPIQIWGSINNNRAILAIMGDPTINFNDYVISNGYIGRMLTFNATYEDVDGNFVMAFSASKGGAGPTGNWDASKTYGEYTSNGNANVLVFKSKSGVLYQAHHISFISPNSAMIKDAFNPSRWTGKFHLSPVYVAHGYDGYRGRLEDVVALDPNSIVHLDELTVTEGANTDTYKYIKSKNVSGFFEDSPNPQYGVAIKKV